MAGSEREIPRRLHSASGEPAMAGGEPCATANFDTMLRTTPEQTNYKDMKYTRS